VKFRSKSRNTPFGGWTLTGGLADHRRREGGPAVTRAFLVLRDGARSLASPSRAGETSER